MNEFSSAVVVLLFSLTILDIPSKASSSKVLYANQLSENVDLEDFCFVSFGCWGGLNKATQKRVANVMGHVVEKSATPTLFVIAAGDNFYKKGVPNVDDPRFITTFDDMYSHPSLQKLPFLVALGNHDYRGNFFAQVNYTSYQLEHVPRATGRWYLPEAYYTKRVHRDMVVFVLDGPLLERCANNGDGSPRCWDHGAQKKYFESQFELYRDVKWKVVVCHYPMFANGPHVNFEWLVSWLQPLLDKYCVDLYINADNHYLQVSRVNGVYYVNSGGGAGFGVRHQASNKNYKKDPHSVFIAFEDGVFYHCVHGNNQSITTRTFNHDGVERFTFTSELGARCHSGAVNDNQARNKRTSAAGGNLGGLKKSRHLSVVEGDTQAEEIVVVDKIPIATLAPTAPNMQLAAILCVLVGVSMYALVVWSRGGVSSNKVGSVLHTKRI